MTTKAATKKRSGKDDEDGDGMADPPLLYLMYVGTLVNGIILAGYNHALIYPGEPIQVRGPAGLRYEEAIRMRLRPMNDFVWCDENGRHIVEDPAPTEEELAAARSSSALVIPGVRGFEWPTHHHVDPDYVDPYADEVRGTEDELQLTVAPPPPPDAAPTVMLNVKQTSNDRRGIGLPGTTEGAALAAPEATPDEAQLQTPAPIVPTPLAVSPPAPVIISQPVQPTDELKIDGGTGGDGDKKPASDK